MRLSLFALVIVYAGCGTKFVSNTGYASQSERKVYIPDKIEIHNPQMVTQRFLTTNTSDMAYDTMTGAFCKTWRWGMDGNLPHTPAMAYELPTCVDLTGLEKDRESKMLEERDRWEGRKWYREHPGQKSPYGY